jgi:hypothetical protein
MGGGAAADPTGLAGRFNPMAGQINAQADAVASGRGWYLGGQFVGATGNPQWGQAENMRRRVELNNAPQQATPEQRASVRERRAGAHRQFMEENNGMNYLQARRAERQAGLKERSFRKAVTRGLNPMSPEAQALFPQQVAKMKGQPVQPNQNPMSNVVGPGSPNTIENVDARATARQANVSTSPTLATWGVDPNMDPTSFSQIVGENLFKRDSMTNNYKMAEVSDDGIQSIFNQVKLFDPTEDGKPPFPEGSVYNQMWSLPEGTPTADIRKMFEGILEQMKATAAATPQPMTRARLF